MLYPRLLSIISEYNTYWDFLDKYTLPSDGSRLTQDPFQKVTYFTSTQALSTSSRRNKRKLIYNHISGVTKLILEPKWIRITASHKRRLGRIYLHLKGVSQPHYVRNGVKRGLYME